MAHWLLKSEPDTWSFAHQQEAGPDGTFWNGVRNHSAKRCLMAMRVGEQCFFYHSGGERAVAGIVAVTKAYYPDHTDPTGRFGMVDVRAVRPLSPVALDRIKGEPRLAEMVLVKNSRLSVQPVTDAEWAVVLEMAGQSAVR
jgi:predicted RNA-binding protein with PUA-like domain